MLDFKSQRLAIFTFVFTFIASFLTNPEPSGRLIGTLGEPNFLAAFLVFIFPFREPAGKWENRNQIWQTAFAAGKINPLFGSGFGNIEKPLKIASEKLGENNLVRYQPIDSAHNIILDFWIQGGAVGVALLLLLIISALVAFSQKQNIFFLTILFGLLTVLMFNPGSIVTLIAFWWVIGQGQNLNLTNQDKIV